MKYALALISIFIFPLQAQARSHHHHHHYRHHHYRSTDRVPSYANMDNNGRYFTSPEPQGRPPGRYSKSTHRQTAEHTGSVVGGRPSGCPYQFCGCAASLHIFGRIIPVLNLAANWFRFPHASPAPGMVAVRNHHVFVIEAVNGDGTVVAYDGNSGHHLTRVHNRSLRGYSVRDPHGSRYASR